MGARKTKIHCLDNEKRRAWIMIGFGCCLLTHIVKEMLKPQSVRTMLSKKVFSQSKEINP